MQTKHFNFPSRILGGAKVNAMKVRLILLILITVFGASGIYSFSELASNPLRCSPGSSTVLNDHILDSVVQQMYLVPENEDSYGLHSKDSPEQGSTLVPDFLKYPIIKSVSETPLDSIISFHYILAYGYSPLRSPPILS